MNSKIIGIAWGGYSSEREISKMSCEKIFKALKLDYKFLFTIEFQKDEWYVYDNSDNKYIINKIDFSFKINNTKIIFDLVVNMVHGSPGENGELALYLENLNIPQTSCNSHAAYLTFNKSKCISAAKRIGIPTSKSITIKQNIPYNLKEIENKIGFPCFVKPNKSGSSFGVYKIYNNNLLEKSIIKSFKEDDEVLIEKALNGREFSVGVIEWDKSIKALPITEIISENDFFDYAAKYQGESKEITPAIINDSWKKMLENYSIELYKSFNLKGIIRSEFIIENNTAYLLEINTIPGMTEKSICPQQLNAAGISLNQFFKKMIESNLL